MMLKERVPYFRSLKNKALGKFLILKVVKEDLGLVNVFKEKRSNFAHDFATV